MSKSSALIALSLCILVTYFWRSLPFLALRGKKLSPSLSRLGELLPPSIMA
ncbi:MAG: AzlD domain-containing protein, partial [Lachnospiraceae bacterium]|nr:AzlD domain-containing protein [Lachnospiraceae bacterium]